MNDFWAYTVWYALLAVVALCELVFALAKAENRRLALGLYLTLTGLALSFETPVLIIFKAYAYYPMLLQTCPFPFDRVLAGSLFSETSVAATALLVAVLGLGFRWQAVLAGLYGLIEEAFLALGVYDHNWYQTWMTVISLLVYFQLAKTLYAALVRGVRPVVFYGSVALGLFPLYLVTIPWALMISGQLDFSRSFLADPIMSRYLLCLVVYAVPAAAVMMSVRYARWPCRAKAAAVAALWLFYYLGSRLDIIVISEGGFWTVNTVTTVWMYISVLAMDRLYADVRKRN